MLQRIDAHFNRHDNIDAYQKNVRDIYLPIPQVITDNTSVSYALGYTKSITGCWTKAASGLIGDPWKICDSSY